MYFSEVICNTTERLKNALGAVQPSVDLKMNQIQLHCPQMKCKF